MAAERLGVELVDELLPRPDELEDPVHVGRMEAVEVDRVRVRILVPEHDPQPVALPGPEGGTRHLPVVGPCRVHHPRRDLDLAALVRKPVLPDEPAPPPPLLAPVEVPQELGRAEPREVHVAHRRIPHVRGRRTYLSPSVGSRTMAPVLPAGAGRVGTENAPRDPQRTHRPRGPQKVPARETMPRLAYCQIGRASCRERV